ncbi:cell wall-active antibiotics response protein LiaF [Paenibacillus yanchengensis]|uniref:Cell wall-active antibiotics response protein LiaF n=1 Tax=Paenibacillus yanchengensis TaxID=2035833 RepID=A0ABW4YPK0_9BACL
MNKKMLSRFFTGVAVIGVGVVILLQQLGFLHISLGSLISLLWPVILIYVGGEAILTSKRHEGWWGYIVLGLGIVFLGRNFGWFFISIGTLIRFAVPIAIIAYGLKMMFKPREKQHEPPEEEWKYYQTRKDDSYNVPPAPPLHPDPTKHVQEQPINEQQNNDQQQHSYNQQQNNQQYNYEQPNSYEQQHFDKSNGYRQPNNEHYNHARRQAEKDKYKYKKYDEYDEYDEYDYYDKEDGADWYRHIGRDKRKTEHRNTFIGDIHVGDEYWEVKPLNISSFIGDTTLDLTKADIPPTETKIYVSSFIGDVKVYLPNDYDIAIQVVSSAFIGEVKLMGKKEGGMFTNVKVNSPYYEQSTHRIKLIVSTFIGDVRVTKVG